MAAERATSLLRFLSVPSPLSDLGFNHHCIFMFHIFPADMISLSLELLRVIMKIS